MRQIIFSFVIPAVFLIAIGTGCATANRLFTESPVALVSVVANNDINWKDEKPVNNAILRKSLRREMEENPDRVIKTSSELVIDDLEEYISEIFTKTAFMTLEQKERILNSRSYSEARINTRQEINHMTKPESYRYIFYRDSKFFPAFVNETGIEKTLFITLDLTKSMSSGIGKNGYLRVHVTMTVLLKDSRGKNLFNKTYEAVSRDRSRVSSGVYSQSELLELIKSAVSDACYHFLDDLGK